VAKRRNHPAESAGASSARRLWLLRPVGPLYRAVKLLLMTGMCAVASPCGTDARELGNSSTIAILRRENVLRRGQGTCGHDLWYVDFY
jgi:hypothetical protein